MQKIPDEAAPEEVRDGIVTEIESLEADPEVAALGSPYRVTVDEYLSLYAEIDVLHLQWIRQEARLILLDQKLDSVLKSFRLALVERSGNKQTGPLFDRYLPEGLRDVTEVGMAVAEPAKVKEILDKLEAEGGPLAAEWRPKLEAARTAVVDQAAARHVVETQQERLGLRLDAKVDVLQASRVELHGQLRGHFKSAPALAEVYFYMWRKPRRRPAAAPTPPPAPVTPPAA